MRPGWRWALGLGGLAVAGGLAWWHSAPLAVTLAASTRGPAVEAIYATGTVEPSVMLPIAPRTGGKLVEVLTDEGQSVHRDQVLARLEDTDLDHTVEELEARVRLARLNRTRKTELAGRNGIARADLDQAAADLEMAEAMLRRAVVQRDFLTLRAPADGVVIRRDGEVGQFIPAGQAVFYFSCCAPLRVSAEVDEEDIPRVHIGQAVVLRADALPDQTFDGEVSGITPKGDPVARSFRVRIRLTDPARLKIGMTVDANLIVTERQDALLLPTSAITDGAVWVVRDGRLHRLRLRTGVTGAARTEVLEGLNPGAAVVAVPSASLREGARVRVSTPDEPK